MLFWYRICWVRRISKVTPFAFCFGRRYSLFPLTFLRLVEATVEFRTTYSHDFALRQEREFFNKRRQTFIENHNLPIPEFTYTNVSTAKRSNAVFVCDKDATFYHTIKQGGIVLSYCSSCHCEVFYDFSLPPMGLLETCFQRRMLTF